MALAVSSSSSSLSSVSVNSFEYDVYLSFRGEDTRDNFVSHLYAALRRKKIITFMDESTLESGDGISAALFRAVEKSRISVVILSENYASSAWCLDELVHILDCQQKFGQIVVPIFYHIHPWDVRKQSGRYAAAFETLEKLYDRDRIQLWREALTKVGNLSGWISSDTRPESKLVDAIVEDILNKLNSLVVSTQDYTHLFGIEEKIEKVTSVLCLGLPDVRILGIWGTSGIGKTELAKVVFKLLIHQFEGGYFLENISESVMIHGSSHLKRELVSGLLEEQKVDLIKGSFVLQRLRRSKVLVVLDDVSDYEILNDLVGDPVTSFGIGSRIIVTTRDIQVLKFCRADEIYEVEGLGYKEALRLFSSFAFGSETVPTDYEKLSERAVIFSKGNPLFLKQLGRYLYQRSLTEWESRLTDSKRSDPQCAWKSHELTESQRLPDCYANLNFDEQQIFLYVACFYQGEDVNFVERILDECGVSAKKGIKSLIESSLIAIRNEKIHMDDRMQSMGLQIIRLACIKELGILNRLWNAEDANRIMETETHLKMASSTYATTISYDVFLSFEGVETRNNFTSHLYVALCQKKMKTYVDFRLDRGDGISPTTLTAIQQSKLAVIIFSESCASSSRCLDELVHIFQCQREKGQIVLPVFYDIDPLHVQKQQGSWATTFSVLEERYKDRMDKVHQWRNALTGVANLPVLDSQVIRSSESKLVDEIATVILMKLNGIEVTNDLKDPVGIHKHFEKIESLLCIGSPNILVLGICGMSGIGKTTMASFLFSQLSSQFEGSSFVANISERSQTHGLIKLQNKLLAELFEEDDLDYMGTTSSRLTVYKERLHRKKVLVVLDDISNPNQFKVLAREHDLFDLGSRIIVTTRDVQVLKNIKANEEYCIGELNYDEALQLFQLHAQNSPRTDSVQLKRVINCAKGIPLALKVLGSYLRDKNEAEWENAVAKLEKVPNLLIQNLLKICYDGLDNEEKEIFLDISCFFKGEDRYLIERAQEVFDSNTTIRIDGLIAKSLITIEKNDKPSMHDLVQEMGWEIGRQRSVKKVGNRSRLWNAGDIYRVLKYDEGSSRVQGILLDISQIGELDLSPTVFSKMYNLRMLKVYNSNDNVKKCKLCLPYGLLSLPHTLRYLHWDEYPLKHLPLNFSCDNLVELIMCNSRVEELWSEVQHLANLRKIDLSYSKHLTQIPDLSKAPNLEIINFQSCISLVRGPSSILHLDKLRSLNLDGCSSIDKFPELSTNMRYLDMSGTAINRIMIFSSISSSRHLETLNLKHCIGLMDLPTSICELTHLKHLNLSGCSTLRNFPEITKPMESLKVLKLEGTTIRELPSSIEKLVGLETLSLDMCEYLKSVPSSIINLNSLKELSLRRCLKLQSLPELPLWLKNLDVEGCSSLKTVSSSRFAIDARQGSDKLPHCGGKFDFINCQELDQNARSNIMSYAQYRMLHMALFSSMDKKGRYTRLHEIWFSGNEIPKWFNYRFEGPSEFLPLPANWCNSNFLGFIICAIVDFRQCPMDQNFRFHFQFRLPMDLLSANAANDTSTFSWNRSNGIVNSDHVLSFYYYNRDWFSITYDDVTQASFHFYSNNNERCKVKGFGVRLLYAQEAETMLNLITREVGTTERVSDDICYEPETIVIGTHEDADIMEEEAEEKLDLWLRKQSKGRSRENVGESSLASQSERKLKRRLEEQQRLMEEQHAYIAQLSQFLSQVIPGVPLPPQQREASQDPPSSSLDPSEKKVIPGISSSPQRREASQDPPSSPLDLSEKKVIPRISSSPQRREASQDPPSSPLDLSEKKVIPRIPLPSQLREASQDPPSSPLDLSEKKVIPRISSSPQRREASQHPPSSPLDLSEKKVIPRISSSPQRREASQHPPSSPLDLSEKKVIPRILSPFQIPSLIIPTASFLSSPRMSFLSSPDQHRQAPVIIYTVSPKVIHATASNFMSVVQRLTGVAPSSSSSFSGTSAGDNFSLAARMASIESTIPSDRERKRKREREGLMEELEGFEIGQIPGILSLEPASLALPAKPSGFCKI